MSRFRRKAFTLAEFIVLATIVAILAATIYPQFSLSARDAKLSNLKFNLRSVRSRLEAYKDEHLGVYPPAGDSAAFSAQMTERSNRGTELNPRGGLFGPYIEGSLPINPFNNRSSVAILQGDTEPTAPTGSNDGWQYNPKHGWFYPNDHEFFQIPGGVANQK